MSLTLYEGECARKALIDAVSLMSAQMDEVGQKLHSYDREDEDEIAEKGPIAEGVALKELVKTRHEGGEHPDFELTKVGKKLCSLYKAELDILGKWQAWAGVAGTPENPAAGLRFLQFSDGDIVVGGIGFMTFNNDSIEAYCRGIQRGHVDLRELTREQTLIDEVHTHCQQNILPGAGFAFMVGIGKVPEYLNDQAFYTGAKKVDGFAESIVAKVQVYLQRVVLVEPLEAVFVGTPLKSMPKILSQRGFKSMDQATHGAQQDVYSLTPAWSEWSCEWSPAARRLLYSSMLKAQGLMTLTNGSFVFPLL